ncbi:hypothetical protein RS75_04095 [Rhizobium nepotum 39/7]|uniref:Aldehyde dehydrogenase domain-containing protein n=1 Tax=Rhizobium nepotum 39/7 TaxID=1368418 RepID=A0ABR5CX37_9HYPH|nr:hypothetical protein RS75_04095 [Rhizobium nepotum 39/7]
MTLSFDPDSLSLPIGHFIGDRLIPAKNGIDMHRPSDGVEYAGCPKADATLVDEAVQTAKAARRLQALRHWQRSRARGYLANRKSKSVLIGL